MMGHETKTPHTYTKCESQRKGDRGTERFHSWVMDRLFSSNNAMDSFIIKQYYIIRNKVCFTNKIARTIKFVQFMQRHLLMFGINLIMATQTIDSIGFVESVTNIVNERLNVKLVNVNVINKIL